MKKFFIISSLVLVILALVGCTNHNANTDANTHTSKSLNQPTEIKLTKSNISSYLGVDITNDSNIYIGDFKNDGFSGSGWLKGTFEVSSFPKKAGHFKNVTIELEYSADSWKTMTPDTLSMTIPFDGKISKNFDIYDLVYSTNGFANPMPSINVNIISVSGSFIKE